MSLGGDFVDAMLGGEMIENKGQAWLKTDFALGFENNVTVMTEQGVRLVLCNVEHYVSAEGAGIRYTPVDRNELEELK